MAGPEYPPSVDPTNTDVLDHVTELLAGHPTSEGALKVVRIPLPPRHESYWYSYNNVIIANKRILIPLYANVDPALQERAVNTFREHLPGWRLFGVQSDSLSRMGGVLRCAAAGIPAFVDLGPLMARVDSDGIVRAESP